ncbi:hypothetical protein Tco_1071354 [Tanacetum coccineum]
MPRRNVRVFLLVSTNSPTSSANIPMTPQNTSPHSQQSNSAHINSMPINPNLGSAHPMEITNGNLHTGIFEEKNKNIFYTDPGDGVRIILTASPVNEVVYHSPVDFTLGIVVLVFDLQVIFDKEKPGSS